MKFQWRAFAATVAMSLSSGLLAPLVQAHAPTASGNVRQTPDALAVRKELPPVPHGVIDLKFRDLFTLPVGPRGLEPSTALRAADGKSVRIVGFMVHQDPPLRGGFLLSPLPVAVGDEDEGLADDLPPALIFVDVAQASGLTIPSMSGLLQISGTLHVGVRENAQDQRISLIRITPDARTTRALLRAAAGDQAQRGP